MFKTGKDGEEILNFVSKHDGTWNFLLNLVFGPYLFFWWLVMGLPAISLAPDFALPPATDDGYAHMGLAQWLWYKYLSLDQ